MEQSDSIKDLAGDLAKAQKAFGPVLKDKDNPFFKSKYADLASGIDAIRDALADNNLSIAQMAETAPNGVTIITQLMHSSGEWIRTSLTLTPTKNDPQGVGSAITYGRRYALFSIVGIASEDDDGNAASAPAAKKSPAPRKQQAEAHGQIDYNSRIAQLMAQHSLSKDFVINKTGYPTLQGLTYDELADVYNRLAASLDPKSV